MKRQLVNHVLVRLFPRQVTRMAVKRSVRRYGKTFTMLEKYDRGDITYRDHLVEHERMRAALYSAADDLEGSTAAS